MSKLFRGTPAQLIDAGLTINGRAVSKLELSTLLKFGANTAFARKVGPVANPNRNKGKPRIIWEIQSTDLLNVGGVDALAYVAPVAAATDATGGDSSGVVDTASVAATA